MDVQIKGEKENPVDKTVWEQDRERKCLTQEGKEREKISSLKSTES